MSHVFITLFVLSQLLLNPEWCPLHINREQHQAYSKMQEKNRSKKPMWWIRHHSTRSQQYWEPQGLFSMSQFSKIFFTCAVSCGRCYWALDGQVLCNSEKPCMNASATTSATTKGEKLLLLFPSSSFWLQLTQKITS